MKHVITITKDDFLKGDYQDHRNCPLAIALKRAFPKAEVHVGPDSFEIKHPKIGFIKRDFKSCQVQSCEYELKIEILEFSHPEYMAWAICEMACNQYNSEVVDLTFNFITA